VNGDPAHVVSPQFDLPGVQSDANLDALGPEFLPDGHGAADRPGGPAAATSGSQPQPHSGGGGQRLNVAVRQHPVIAKRVAEQMGGHDRHALGVQAAALDVGVVDAQQRGRAGAEQVADRLGFPARQPR
jgi:hypothetical protein